MAKAKPETLIQDLAAEAVKTVYVKDPLLTYKKHFRGREVEYSYRQFLDDLESQKPKPVVVETLVETVVDNANH